MKRNPKDKREFKHEKQICPNVWYFNNKYEMTLFKHPTIKPLKLIKTIVKASSNVNDLILDSFMGSGTTGVACMNLNRKFIGIEKEKDYFEIAKARIQEAKNQTRLF